MEPIFDHEKLDAYQAALEFAAWAGGVIERLPAKLSARDQLDRASTSAVLNVAEGNGKYSLRDRRRYFEIALGSEFECAAAVDVIILRKHLSVAVGALGKQMLHRAVSTLSGLIRSLDRRLSESDPPIYDMGGGV
jgi:four helix bundle protein